MTTTNAAAAPDDGLSARQRRAVSLSHAIDLLQLERVDVLGRDRVDELPTEAVLAVDAGLVAGERRALRRVARILPHLPSLRAAVKDGRTSFGLAAEVCGAASSQRLTVGHLALLDEVVAALLADRRDADDVLEAIRDHVVALRPDVSEQAEAAVADRVTFSPRLFGGGEVVVDATTETYALLTGAIDHVVERDRLLDRATLQADDGTDEAWAHNHDVRAGARGAAVRTMAAGTLAGRSKEGTPRPPRPSIQVVVPLEALVGETSEPARLLTGGRMTATRLRRLLERDGADVRGVVVDTQGGGEVVGVGRRTRVAPGWLDQLTRALQPRCVMPGCRARATDLDHAERWADGGATELSNLSRLCRRHHVAKDREAAWRLEPDAAGAVRVTHAASGWTATTRPWPNGPPAADRTEATPARRTSQPRLPLAQAERSPPRAVDGQPF